MTEFLLIHGKMNWWDIVYPGEKPRYMIDGKRNSCTCEGNTNGLNCKHLKEFYKIKNK